MARKVTPVGGKPAVASRNDTIAALLDRSNRDHVPVRTTFLQQGTGRRRTPGPLAALVSNRDERALDLYLLYRSVTSSGDYDVTLGAGVWARALGLSDSPSALSAVSKASRRLDRLKLIARSRDGSRAKITVLDESGTGDPYTHPGSARGQRYLKLPHAYWTDAWDLKLNLAAKAVLLIALSLDDGFVLPAERAPDWYGISADTAQRGLATLRDHGLLDLNVTSKPAPLAPAGFAVVHEYTLQAPFGPRRVPLATVTKLKTAGA